MVGVGVVDAFGDWDDCGGVLPGGGANARLVYRARNMKTPPKGPVNLIRRKILPKCAQLCAFVGLMILGVWVVGRVLTDQFSWSQYLWWIPPIWAIGSAWGLLVVSAVLGKFALRPGGMILRPLLLLACIGCSVFLVFGIWRMHRAVLGRPIVDAPSVRILHWNQSAFKGLDKATPVIVSQDPDLVLLVNSRGNRRRIDLIHQLEYMAPSEEEFRLRPGVRAHFQPDHFTIQGQALVASKLPIIRTGTVTLEQIVDLETASRKTGQHAWVMFIELDLRERFPDGPSSMMVWLVDLPSEPTLWRMTSMRTAVRAINGWNGQYRVSNGTGGWDVVHTDEPFPEPDIVIGDFNALRGSASIKELAPSMKDAFAQAGYGRAKTWTPRIRNKYVRQPMKFADWHIDLTMTGYRWRASSYRLIDPPAGTHDMQVVDLTPQRPHAE